MKSALVLLSLLGFGLCMPQDVVFGEGEKAPENAPAPAATPDIITRAQSTFQNCDCQCDSYTWSAKGRILGNCLSPDASGGNFCYVSGRAIQACRDVQESETRKDSFSDLGKFYSYEACATPPRDQCYGVSNSPNQNFGEGDFVPAGGAYPSGGRPPIGNGPGPFTGSGPINGPGSGISGGNPQLGAILGVRAGSDKGEVSETPSPAEGGKPDADSITFAES